VTAPGCHHTRGGFECFRERGHAGDHFDPRWDRDERTGPPRGVYFDDEGPDYDAIDDTAARPRLVGQWAPS